MRIVCAAVLLVLLAGCGGGSDDANKQTRDEVAVYIAQANGVQQQLRNPLNEIAKATEAFSRAKDPATATPGLTRAEATLRRLRTRLGALKPPPAARELHRRLLALVDREVSLSDETRRLSVFTPALVETLQPLVAANARARADLGSTKNPDQVVTALDAYRASIDSVLVKARQLDAPPAVQPLKTAQVRRLEALSSSLQRLAAAVRERRAADVPKLQHAVSVASVSSDTQTVQRAQQAAVRAYNARARSIQTLAARVQTERNRLQTTLR